VLPLISSNSIGWRALRVACVILSGIIAAMVLSRVLRPHCTASEVSAWVCGPPLGYAVSTGALSHLRRGQWLRTVMMALAVGIGSLAACGITITNLTDNLDVGKQLHTMAEMRQIAKEIEHGRSVEERRDGWGTPYLIRRDVAGYTIVSFGDCGNPDVPVGSEYSAGPTTGFKADIVFANGQFIRYPRGRLE